MFKSALDVFNEMLNDKGRNVLYYEKALTHDSFTTLDFSDIEQYFIDGNKKGCIPDVCKQFFDKKGNRVRHVFSVYLLGIYCYDNITVIKSDFNDFIEKIWKATEYSADAANKEDDLRRDFLYLWYLTALFHDMGYPYEREKEIVDNERYESISSIITEKTMMKKDCFDCRGNILGIPKAVKNAAKGYFYHRLKDCCFNEKTCVDHGFAGGYILYKALKDLHCGSQYKSPVDINKNRLVFSKYIFDNYNIPSAWAIVCHNIWLAEFGRGRDEKYKHFKLDELIFESEHSLINHKDHPLLFLLDFLDTLDPVKRFGESALDCIFFSSSNGNVDVLTMKICCCQNCKTSCAMSGVCMDKIRKDLSFLKSDTFDFKTNDDDSITFSFCSAIKI